MDTSETNIKMCEKADEIQKQIPEDEYGHILPHQFFVGELGICKEDDGCYYGGGDKKFIWLPLQGQLQEGSGLNWQEFDRACLSYEAPSKEQAGIQVWMREKYNKAWNGEEWI